MKIFLSLLFCISNLALAKPHLISDSSFSSENSSKSDSFPFSDNAFTIKLISPYKQIKKGTPFLAGIQIKNGGRLVHLLVFSR